MQVAEGAGLIALGVLVLTGPQAPDEGAEADEAKCDRDGDEEGEDVHRNLRTAFNVTVKDDSDMEIAAAKGVARPAIARGTETRL